MTQEDSPLKPTREGLGMLLVAYVFAGLAVAFGVAIIAAFIGLPAPAIAVVVIAALVGLGFLVFRGPASSSVNDKEHDRG